MICVHVNIPTILTCDAVVCKSRLILRISIVLISNWLQLHTICSYLLSITPAYLLRRILQAIWYLVLILLDCIFIMKFFFAGHFLIRPLSSQVVWPMPLLNLYTSSVCLQMNGLTGLAALPWVPGRNHPPPPGNFLIIPVTFLTDMYL